MSEYKKNIEQSYELDVRLEAERQRRRKGAALSSSLLSILFLAACGVVVGFLIFAWMGAKKDHLAAEIDSRRRLNEDLDFGKSWRLSAITALAELGIPLQHGVTLKQYKEIEPGMTKEEVFAILGEPDQELSKTEIAGHTGAMYMWVGRYEDGGNMNVLFQDGRVVTKAQFMLQ